MNYTKKQQQIVPKKQEQYRGLNQKIINFLTVNPLVFKRWDQLIRSETNLSQTKIIPHKIELGVVKNILVGIIIYRNIPTHSIILFYLR
jgi:hypothetical protein